MQSCGGGTDAPVRYQQLSPWARTGVPPVLRAVSAVGCCAPVFHQQTKILKENIA